MSEHNMKIVSFLALLSLGCAGTHHRVISTLPPDVHISGLSHKHQQSVQTVCLFDCRLFHNAGNESDFYCIHGRQILVSLRCIY